MVLNELVPGRARVGFQTRSGRLFVEGGTDGELVLDLPLSRPRPVDAETRDRVARALGVVNAPAGLFDLTRNTGAPASLRELGMVEADLDRAADLAVADPYWNPRPIERDGVRQLLADAWCGRRPD